MLLGLRTVIYPAPDLEKAKAWYTQALGFGPYFDEPYYVGYSVQGFELGLIPDATPSSDGAQALWGVSNIEEALEHLVSIGGAMSDPITDVGAGIRVASVLDPFGNRFGIIENPNFAYEQLP